MTPTIRILGIDPGLRLTGWVVIEATGPRLTWVAHGVVAPDPSTDMADRLALLAAGIRAVIIAHAPHESAVEETFVNINPRSTTACFTLRVANSATLS